MSRRPLLRLQYSLAVFVIAFCPASGLTAATPKKPPAKLNLYLLGANFLKIVKHQAATEVAGAAAEYILHKLGIRCDLCDMLSLFYDVKTGSFIWCKHCGQATGRALVVIGDRKPHIDAVYLRLSHGSSYSSGTKFPSPIVEIDITVNGHIIRRNYSVPKSETLVEDLTRWCRLGRNSIIITATKRCNSWYDFRGCEVGITLDSGLNEGRNAIWLDYKAEVTGAPQKLGDPRVLCWTSAGFHVVGNFSNPFNFSNHLAMGYVAYDKSDGSRIRLGPKKLRRGGGMLLGASFEIR